MVKVLVEVVVRAWQSAGLTIALDAVVSGRVYFGRILRAKKSSRVGNFAAQASSVFVVWHLRAVLQSTL